MALSDRAIERSTAVVHGFIRTRTGRMQKCARVTWKHGVLTFQAIRESPEIEKLYCRIEIRDFSIQAVETCLRFMYSGELKVKLRSQTNTQFTN